MSNQANIKAVTRHLVDRVGGLQAAADICGTSKSEVSYWGNDNHDRFIPADHLVDLDAAADDIFLKEWARTRGYDLLAIEGGAAQQAAIESAIRAGALVAQAATAVNFNIVDLLSDGHKSATDERLIRDRLAQLKDEIDRLERSIS
jgi:hypothetical protein